MDETGPGQAKVPAHFGGVVASYRIICSPPQSKGDRRFFRCLLKKGMFRTGRGRKGWPERGAGGSLLLMETILFDRLTILTLKSVLFLARHGEEKRYYKVKEMADALGVSRSYLARIIQTLVKNNVLISSTGPSGGFRFPEENMDMTVDQVIAFTGYAEAFNRCLMEWPGCNRDAPCPLHRNWERFKEGVRKEFATLTIRHARRLLYDRIES